MSVTASKKTRAKSSPPKLADYSYTLPAGLIANRPAKPRDSCRLLVLDNCLHQISHHRFFELDKFLIPGDVLVFNQSKVFPARLFGHKSSGGQIELLLLHPTSSFSWTAISSPRPSVNTQLNFPKNLNAKVTVSNPHTGEITLCFNQKSSAVYSLLDQIGQTPLPPYISSPLSETFRRRHYQTVFAAPVGSAAAPTAGLHFTPRLLRKLKNFGVQLEFITLHVGLGTFQPLRSENFQTDKLHREFYSIDQATANRLKLAKAEHRRIIAVGTTTSRALESGFDRCSTDIFIHPPYQFKIIDGLITNFHLPRSSLLMLLTAFISAPKFKGSILHRAYRQAILHQYRFYSFGDAMLVLK